VADQLDAADLREVADAAHQLGRESSVIAVASRRQLLLLALAPLLLVRARGERRLHESTASSASPR
jgi:hypothetical protein